MPEFVINVDVPTEGKNTVEVTITPRNQLRLGRHLFQLVVFDEANNKSAPDVVEVLVADQEGPTAVLKAPRVVAFGKSFELDGSGSFDRGGGSVTRHFWTYLGPTNL